MWSYFISPPTTNQKVSQQTQKYKNILSEIQKTQSSSPPLHNYISPEEKQMMMEELKQLLIDEPLPMPYFLSETTNSETTKSETTITDNIQKQITEII
jgi:hypothetical protein